MDEGVTRWTLDRVHRHQAVPASTGQRERDDQLQHTDKRRI